MTCDYVIYHVTVICNIMLTPNPKFKNRKQIKKKIKIRKEIRIIESTIFSSDITLVLSNPQILGIKIYKVDRSLVRKSEME